MSKQKQTLSDIRKRRALVLSQIKQTEHEIQSDFYNLTHPFGSIGSGRFSSFPSIRKIMNVVSNVRLAFSVASKVASFFRKR